VALVLARPLNALALGEDAGRALGARVGGTRVAGALAVTLLCGAATAAAGPIFFIGLTVPHIARALCGPDQRWVIPYSAVLAPTLLLAADVIGRVVDRPGEIEVGIVCALLGGPVFVALIRRRRIAQL
jgi:iron complex transport system permease protein